ARLRTLRDDLADERLTELSMGMSEDLEIAIEEGATIVRLGSAIFGPRSTR
ncbi:MAG: YggS family pyridoxal phosphate-dependent enzyme, partial [Micrococcus sp.]|nr:YggS family pyridoxal phosphate-dependent enzyme [Micrococcus sp.]